MLVHDTSTSFDDSNISENLLALQAPSTTKCDLCQVSFCGIGVQGRCTAAPLLSQHPHGMSDVIDLIQSEEVYECFDSNTVEVEFLVDYLTTQRLTPRHIYREVRHLPRLVHPNVSSFRLDCDTHSITA
jgi:E3 ubiquitin-protein ligase CHFR